ncbi:MAG: metal ABC transporter permease [Phycisphaerae bacterium]|nr:metal ABC transporter permease [Phycisphaerae bacterium]
MKTLHYLTGPESDLFWPAIAAGAAVALVCGVLSVFVVLRRLAFIGHGVSHAAFGGVGLAVVLGLTASGTAHTLAYLAVVGGFCLIAALSIAVVSAQTRLREDTVIGVTLVGSMALGALLLQLHARRGGSGAGATLESTLFGSILSVRPADALAAWVVALTVGAVLLVYRRPLVFWAFDETAAEAFGVNALRTRLLLMALLGIAIVASMKLAGVLLATALLILPGAIALRLSQRLATVFVLAAASSITGVLGGLMLSFEADWPPGPSVVVVLVALMLASAAVGFVRGRSPG